MLEKVDSNDRIHPSFLLHGTVTGRLSSKGPNIQNIPRDKKVKGMFIPEEGFLLVEADYSQAELRVMAFYSKDEVLVEKYRKNEDVHLATACFIFGKKPEDILKPERKRAKLVNFGYLYGATAKKAHSSILEKAEEGEEVPTLSEMAKFREGFFNLYKGIAKYIKDVHKLIIRDGKIMNCFGRTRRLPQVNSPYEEKQAEALREGLNAIIQSTASDITQIGVIRINRMFLERELKSRFLFTVHDAVLMEIHKSEVWILDEVRELMEHPPAPFNMPIAVDIEIYERAWGNDGVDWEKYKTSL